MQNAPPRSYQQLQPEDRVTLASLVQQKYGVRQIARMLEHSPGTVSRELRRNALPTGYASTPAHACSLNRLIRALGQRWSPAQIALTLARIHPKGHAYRVSHEAIDNCIYAQPVGERKRELIATLRHAHNKRVPRSKGQDRRAQISDMLSIYLRPPEMEDRQFLGHWEGDLIKGAANARQPMC